MTDQQLFNIADEKVEQGTEYFFACALHGFKDYALDNETEQVAEERNQSIISLKKVHQLIQYMGINPQEIDESIQYLSEPDKALK